MCCLKKIFILFVFGVKSPSKQLSIYENPSISRCGSTLQREGSIECADEYKKKTKQITREDFSPFEFLTDDEHREKDSDSKKSDVDIYVNQLPEDSAFQSKKLFDIKKNNESSVLVKPFLRNQSKNNLQVLEANNVDLSFSVFSPPVATSFESCTEDNGNYNCHNLIFNNKEREILPPTEGLTSSSNDQHFLSNQVLNNDESVAVQNERAVYFSYNDVQNCGFLNLLNNKFAQFYVFHNGECHSVFLNFEIYEAIYRFKKDDKEIYKKNFYLYNGESDLFRKIKKYRVRIILISLFILVCVFLAVYLPVCFFVINKKEK